MMLRWHPRSKKNLFASFQKRKENDLPISKQGGKCFEKSLFSLVFSFNSNKWKKNSLSSNLFSLIFFP